MRLEELEKQIGYNFKDKDLSIYGVVGVLNKAEMVPKDVKRYVEQYT